MKIAVSSTGKSVEGNVSDVFGRCSYFIIVEIEDDKIKNTETIENKSTEQTSGAGISTGQLIAEQEIKAVITGNVGPRALDILGQFGIKIYSGKGRIKDVLDNFLKGGLEEIKTSGCERCKYKE